MGKDGPMAQQKRPENTAHRSPMEASLLKSFWEVGRKYSKEAGWMFILISKHNVDNGVTYIMWTHPPLDGTIESQKKCSCTDR